MAVLTVVASALADLPHAVIGAVALGAHGVARATSDVDLLVADAAALDPERWVAARAAGLHVDLRRGDAWDPLVGVARVRQGRGMPVDVVVVGAWVREMLARAAAGPRIRLRGIELPLIEPADLVLLKLYAGSASDLHDAESLLAACPAAALPLAERLPAAPDGCGEAWDRLLRARRL